MDKLQHSVNNFVALEELLTDGSYQLFHKVIASVHDLCFSILEAEKRGISRSIIEETISPAKEIHGRSVFVKRMQEWPRKYPGDYETIEYLCDHENKSMYGTVEYYIEAYALNSTIAQQHRNKLHHQAGMILDALLNREGTQKIVSFGCGGCRDVLAIYKYIKSVQCILIINDIDPEALELSRRRLEHFREVHIVSGNIIQALRKVEQLGPFDLVVAGGLFDHLSDKHISFFLKHASHTLLKDDGRLFFANAVEGNPFRVWMEYLADWKLNYRSEQDLRALLTAAGFGNDAFSIKKDETGLTFFVEARIN